MMGAVAVKSYILPQVDLREVLRYAACREMAEDVTALAREVMLLAENSLRPQVCWREVEISVEGDTVVFPFGRAQSQKLAQRLEGCQRAVIFAATVGLELDRLIARYGRLSPAKGLMLQALGSERIEALCDAFCEDLAREYKQTKPLFSPGYGDLPLAFQKELFRVLECDRRIGLYLNESLLMSPSKSVTAIVRLGGAAEDCQSGCSACSKTDCGFRRM